VITALLGESNGVVPLRPRRHARFFHGIGSSADAKNEGVKYINEIISANINEFFIPDWLLLGLLPR
jgi:hypothetical protein